MGCAGSTASPIKRTAAEEESAELAEAMAEVIETVTLRYEQMLEPLRAEIEQHQENYKVQLADTINKRMPVHTGGLGSVRALRSQP